MFETNRSDWQSLYKDAVLNSDQKTMRARIETARAAICSRITQYRQQSTVDISERSKLDSAMYFLAVLNDLLEKKHPRRRKVHGGAQ